MPGTVRAGPHEGSSLPLPSRQQARRSHGGRLSLRPRFDRDHRAPGRALSRAGRLRRDSRDAREPLRRGQRRRARAGPAGCLVRDRRQLDRRQRRLSGNCRLSRVARDRLLGTGRQARLCGRHRDHHLRRRLAHRLRPLPGSSLHNSSVGATHAREDRAGEDRLRRSQLRRDLGRGGPRRQGKPGSRWSARTSRPTGSWPGSPIPS